MGISGTGPAPFDAGVTVVVPVYNPSHYIERTIASLLDQTLPRTRYEVIFVDDGSTDGTEARLDELAAEHPDLVRVIHLPSSGGPGGPRNLGTDLAEHHYVFYCDADDWLPRDALETMVDRAVLDGSDVLIAKSIGNRRTVPLALFDRGDFCTTLAETPGVFTTLTCQKLFRRDYLVGKGIRFREGRVRIEDYIFMAEAYLRAERISILGSRPCYVFEARTDGGNITATPALPMDRLDSVTKWIDVVDTFAVDDQTRDVGLSRVVHSGLLSVIGSRGFLRRPPEEREAIVQAVAHLLRTRIPATVVSRMGARNRRILLAVLDDDRGVLERWVAWECGVQVVARAAEVVVERERVHLDLEVELSEQGQTVRLARVDGRIMLLHPSGSAESVDSQGYDVTEDVRRTAVHVVLRNGQTTENWRVEADLQAIPGDTCDAVELRWRARAVIDVAGAGGGQRLNDGVWRVRAQVTCLGPTRTSPINATDAVVASQPGLRREGAVQAIRTRPGLLAVRVGPRAGGRSPRSAADGGAAGISGIDTPGADASSSMRRTTAWRRWVSPAARGLGLTITEVRPGTLLLSRRRSPSVARLNAATFVVAQGRNSARVRTRQLAGGSWLVDVPAARSHPARDTAAADPAADQGPDVDEIADRVWLLSDPHRLPDSEPARETEVLRGFGTRHVAWLLDRYEIDCVLDVGANQGDYASAIRRAGYTGHIVSLETAPQPTAELTRLAEGDDTWSVHDVALPDAGRRLDAILDDLLAPVIESGVSRPRILLRIPAPSPEADMFAGLGDRATDVVVLQTTVALLDGDAQLPRWSDALTVFEAAGLELAGLYPVARERDGRVSAYECTMVRAAALPRETSPK